MQGKTQPSTDATDRAVSPVIGVVLLVGITVVLTAAVGALVFGAGENAASALGTDAEPNMTVVFGTDNVTVTHNGGGEVPADELVVAGDVSGDPVTWDEYGTVGEGDSLTLDTTAETPEVYVVLRSAMGDETLLVKATA